MALNKTDKSFKTLINKRFTTPDRKFYQEIGKDTLNTHMREVWMNTIPEDSASAIIQGYAAYYEQWILTSDPTYADQAFYFISGSGFTPGTDSINSGWLVNEASQSFFIGDFISDKYGSSYEVKLYDNNDNQIFKTDAINWIFDYKTGVLHIADPGAYPTPYKVTVFKYTGLTLADPGAIPSGSISGSVSNWTGSVDGSISRYSDVKITGSVNIDGNISGSSFIFGDITGTGLSSYIRTFHGSRMFNMYTPEGYWLDFRQAAQGNNVSQANPMFRLWRVATILPGDYYTGEIIQVRNWDSASKSDNIVLKYNDGTSDSTEQTAFSVDYYGNTFVSGNITLPIGKTVDGVDINIFSSSVATQIANLETGSGQWTIELDGSISRNSDVRITGSLYISGSDNRLYGTASWADSSSQAVSSSYAVTSSYAESVAPGIGGLWTGSEGYIERFGTVKVSGSMYYRQGDRIYFGDGDTYIHESSDDQISMVFPAGIAYFDAYQISFTGFNSPGFGNVTATATVPNIVPRIADIDTGLGHAAEDILSLIAGGTNILNVVYASNTGSVGIGTTSPVSLVGPGGLHVWNNISASNLYWEDTDLTLFSSSVEQRITNAETGSALWSLESDGSISRDSDVKITGSLDLVKDENINLAAEYRIYVTDGFSDEILYIRNKDGLTAGGQGIVLYAPAINLITNEDPLRTGNFGILLGAASANDVPIKSYGHFEFTNPNTWHTMSGNIDVGKTGSFGYLETDTDIKIYGTLFTEFSSSVAQQIVNIETGSSIWSLEGDNSISRNSDVRITGSLYTSQIMYADSASIGSTPTKGIITALASPNILFAASSALNHRLAYFQQLTDLILSPSTINVPTVEIVRANQNGYVSTYTEPLLKLRNRDDTSTSDNFIIQSGDTLVDRFTIDYYGNTFVSGNLSLSTGSTVDGVDISEFSSSVAINLTTLNAITSSYWTGSADGSITRLSDAKITGSLYFTGSKWEDRIVLPDTQYVKLGDDWKFSSIDSNNEFYIEFNKAGTNIGTFGLQPGSQDKINLEIYSGSVIINTQGAAAALTNGIVLTAYGQSLLYGNVDVRSNILMQGGKTVDGVDISEFSSSVAQQIVNIETGSSIWSLENDGSISRDSDVIITGSVHTTGSAYYYRAVDDYVKVGDLTSIAAFPDGALGIYNRLETYGLALYIYEATVGSAKRVLLETDATRFDIYSGGGDLVIYSATDITFEANNINLDGDGNLFVTGNISLPGAATVDGVDISEFSSSVAQQIYNLETGSGQWTVELDGSISRNSDVRITGSLDINGNITGDITRTNLSYKSTMSADYSAIIGGAFNEMVGASNNYNIILGGRYNNFVNNNTDFAGILAGELNTMAADWSVILGGYDNTMNGELSAILGGQENKIDWDAIQGVILGGVGLINSGSSQVVLGEWNKKGNISDIFVIGNGTDDLNRSDSFTITSGGDLTLSGSITLSPSETVDGVDISSFSSSVEQRITNAETGSALWSLEQDGSITRDSDVRITGSVFINSSTYPALTIRELATAYYLQFYVDTPNVAGILFNDSAGDPAIEDNASAFTFYGGGGGKLIRIYGDTSDIKIGNLLSNKIMMTGSVNITGSTAISGNLDVSESGSFSYLSVDDSVITELITANTGSLDLLDVAVSASFQDYVEVDGFMHIDGGTW